MSTLEPLTAERIRAIFTEGPFDESSLDRAAPYYADDVVFTDPIQTLRGRDTFLSMNKRLIKRVKQIRFDMHALASTEECIFMTWTMHVALATPATEMHIDGVTHLALRDGRVVRQRDYWDLVGSMMDAIPVAGGVYKALVAKLG